MDEVDDDYSTEQAKYHVATNNIEAMKKKYLVNAILQIVSINSSEIERMIRQNQKYLKLYIFRQQWMI